jgi:hypothetical protein
VPANVETHGHLNKRDVQYIRTLNDIASARFLAVPRESFLASVHRELSVALVQSQGYVYCSCALMLAKAAGRQVLHGADAPFLD